MGSDGGWPSHNCKRTEVESRDYEIYDHHHLRKQISTVSKLILAERRMNPEVKRSPNRLLADLQQQEGLRAKSYKLAQGRLNRKRAMKPSIDFNESLKDSPKFR